MSTFNWAPSYEPQLTVKPAVLTAKFGDGYEQRIPDGINNNPEVWQLSFTDRLDTKITAIRNFLATAAQAATSFDWTSPTGTVGKFKCSEYAYRLIAPNVGAITATFEQVFE